MSVHGPDIVVVYDLLVFKHVIVPVDGSIPYVVSFEDFYPFRSSLLLHLYIDYFVKLQTFVHLVVFGVSVKAAGGEDFLQRVYRDKRQSEAAVLRRVNSVRRLVEACAETGGWTLGELSAVHIVTEGFQLEVES